MTERKRYYLDHAATTAVSPAVLEVFADACRQYPGNASSQYLSGRKARQALEDARSRIAGCLGAKASEIFFTSGGSESDNWALKGVMLQDLSRSSHLITSRIEHPALMNTARFLEKQGYPVSWLEVSETGRVSAEDALAAIRPNTRLISVMAANNETGTTQPVNELSRLAHEKGILFHTDAVQAVTTAPSLICQAEPDMLSLSAHKFHGPKGIGVLYVRSGTRIESFLHGGEQERGLRASTENVPAACAMAAALEEAIAHAEEHDKRLQALCRTLLSDIRSALPDVWVNGDPDHHLPGILNLSFPGVRNEALVQVLDMNGVEASAGSACTAGSLVKSHVLTAMGFTQERILGSLRLSPGAEQTVEEMHEAAAVIIRTVQKLRA